MNTCATISQPKSLSSLQTILCGMGELHIDIIHDRIRREYGIETHLGPLQVAYRETILTEVSTTGTTNTFLHQGIRLWAEEKWFLDYPVLVPIL